jgi:hypothetical protein
MTTIDEQVAFETLIYTDCVPGQGLRGTAGLQFQARSPAADREAMALVQRSLLYEPPAAWMRERRPTNEYPISFGHIHDGLYATASGVYRGREANGAREGNQLTHSIVTRDAQAYGLVRPAQLCQASFWTTDPQPTTSCPPITSGWEPGPFTAEAAQAFVMDRRDGPDRLCALVSALDRLSGEDARRVLFIADDPVEVLRWLAAATLLIPQRTALTIGFKVFSTNPAYAPQPVVAVHPAWDSTTATVDNAAGYVVFDLVTGRYTPVPPTPLAKRRVETLCQRDAYDVVDLIEVVSLIELPAEHSVEVAFDLGTAMVWQDTSFPADLARIAVTWLRDTDPRVLAPYRGALVDRLLEGVERWPVEVLAVLDQVALGGQVPADRVAPVRLALVRAELDRASRELPAAELPLRDLPAEVWTGEHRHAAEDLVVDALRACPSRRPMAFDRLLRAATRLGVTVRLDDAAEAVAAFVADWAEHPERRHDPRAWSCGERLDGMLRAALDDRIAAGDGDWVGDTWWATLSPGLRMLASELDWRILEGAMLNSTESRRRELVRRFVGAAEQSSAPVRVLQVVHALWARTAPTDGELADLCRLLPNGPRLPDRLFESVVRRLLGPDRLAPDLLRLARHLVDRELFRPPSAVRTLLLVDRELEQVCARVSAGRDWQRCEADVERVRTADPRLRERWAVELAVALWEVVAPEPVAAMLRVLPDAGYRTYLRPLMQALHDGPSSERLVLAFYIAWSEDVVDEPDRVRLSSLLRTVLSSRSERKLRPASAIVAGLGKPWVRRWTGLQQEAHELAKRSLLPRWPIRGKG